MERSVIHALEGLPALRDTLRLLDEAAAAAVSAFASGGAAYVAGNEALCGARVERCERLLGEMRGLCKEGVKGADAVVGRVRSGGRGRGKAWDALGDAWWETRARELVERLGTVRGALLGVFEEGGAGGGGGYGARVGRVAERVRVVVAELEGLLEWCAEWQSIAVAVYEGCDSGTVFEDRGVRMGL